MENNQVRLNQLECNYMADHMAENQATFGFYYRASQKWDEGLIQVIDLLGKLYNWVGLFLSKTININFDWESALEVKKTQKQQ